MHDEVQYLLMTYHRDELPAVRTTEQHEKSREPIEFLSFHFFFHWDTDDVSKDAILVAASRACAISLAPLITKAVCFQHS